MTTQEFINKNFGVESNKDRHCSSVFADNQGNIYSYGYHYPLLFKVGNKNYRNVTGYSNSTAKHINWTRDINAIDVCISGCNQYTYRNPENTMKIPHLLTIAKYGMDKKLEKALNKAIKHDLVEEISDIQTRMYAKKRKDTQVYKALEYELDYAIKQLESFNS